ncbi:MAG: AhpC/TSA family protein [Flavobacterium sp.]|nr:AhpC/TSA family protein [Flavobacterium sp.]
MKKLLIVLTFSSVLFSCNNVEKDEFILEGTAQGLEDGKKVYLEQQNESMGSYAIDSTVINEGKFSFKGKIFEPELHLITLEGIQPKSFVILENGKINIEIDKDSVFKNKISGTYNNDQLSEYNLIARKISEKMRNYQLVNNQKMQTAIESQDTATIGTLRRTYMGIQNELQTTTEKYIEEHPKALISMLLLEGFFTSPQPDVEKIKTLYGKMDSDLKNSKIGKKVEQKISETKVVSIGKKAPEFSAADPNGKQVSLSESLGKVTIIDFWASWCGPCRAENPNVVALYNDYKDKGLKIIGVSLDRPGQANKWKEAIAKDGLTWTQVSNLKFWQDPIAEMYGIQSIPATFILDQNGIVVAKDLRGAELRAKIAQLLGA